MTTVPWQSRNRSRKALWIVWTLLLVPLLMMAIYPRLQDYLLAASLLRRISDPHASGWLANYGVNSVDARDMTFDFRDAKIPARIYTPRGVASAPGIVVVHGMHDMGMDGPRLVGFARSLAASGFIVMTPQVAGLAAYRVEAESADLIGVAARELARMLQVPRVGVFAISFAGGLTLLAASDPAYASSIAWVASVGGHYDLAHVLRFFATGEALRPGGSVEHLSPHEYGPLIVVLDEPQDFFGPQDAEKARNALKLLLAGHGKDSEAITATLSPEGQEIMQNIYHQRREALAPAILAEIEKRRTQLAAASPAGHLHSLRMPVLLLHGSDDTVIPPTEMLWLEREVPRATLAAALISPAITHVDVGSSVGLRDQLALVNWVASMLREARTTAAGRVAQVPGGAWLFQEP